MTDDWTKEEIETEWRYIYDERLALLGCCGTRAPTPEQHEIAKKQADAWKNMILNAMNSEV